jgi:hypothetical protein
MPRRLAGLLLACACGLHAVAQAQSGKARVLASWRRHQNLIDSATFRWTELQAHRRDWLPNPRHPEPEHAADPRLTSERTDTVLRVVNVAGNRLQYSVSIKRGAAGALGPAAASRISAWSDRDPHAQDLWIRPVLLNLRPLDRHLGQQALGRAAIVRIDSIFRNQHLLVLEEPFDTAGWKYALWVDPERDDVVRRLMLVRQIFEMIQVDIEYLQDPDAGWVPCRWVINRRKPAGSLWRSDSAVLTGYRINGRERTIPAPVPGSRDRSCR